MRTPFHKAARLGVEFFAGLYRGTLTPKEKHINELKIAGGLLLIAFSAAEANIPGLIGGGIPLAEGAQAIIHSGHDWMIEHHILDK